VGVGPPRDCEIVTVPGHQIKSQKGPPRTREREKKKSEKCRRGRSGESVSLIAWRSWVGGVVDEVGTGRDVGARWRRDAELVGTCHRDVEARRKLVLSWCRDPGGLPNDDR